MKASEKERLIMSEYEDVYHQCSVLLKLLIANKYSWDYEHQNRVIEKIREHHAKMSKLMDEFKSIVVEGQGELPLTITLSGDYMVSACVGQSEPLKCMMKRTDGNCDCGIGSCIEGGW